MGTKRTLDRSENQEESVVLTWDQNRAIEFFRSKVMICRACGQTFPYYPPEDWLRHQLGHADNVERSVIQEVLNALASKDGIAELRKIFLQNLEDPRFVEFALKNRLLLRVRGEGS